MNVAALNSQGGSRRICRAIGPSGKLERLFVERLFRDPRSTEPTVDGSEVVRAGDQHANAVLASTSKE
jgi:hypothetical protein